MAVMRGLIFISSGIRNNDSCGMEIELQVTERDDDKNPF